MTQYLAKSLVPSLRKVIQEQDRIIAVVTNMVYYVVVPNIKARAT